MARFLTDADSAAGAFNSAVAVTPDGSSTAYTGGVTVASWQQDRGPTGSTFLVGTPITDLVIQQEGIYVWSFTVHSGIGVDWVTVKFWDVTFASDPTFYDDNNFLNANHTSWTVPLPNSGHTSLLTLPPMHHRAGQHVQWDFDLAPAGATSVQVLVGCTRLAP